MPKKGDKCYVHLGRFGDEIILFPGWKKEFDDTGRKPVVMVSREFASIFDGVSYVHPWIEDLQFCGQARRAKALAESQFEKVVFPRWWDIGEPPPSKETSPQVKVSFQGNEFSLAADDWVSHQISQWRVAGFDDAGLKTWPLVFDRRDARRETALAKSVFKSSKPKLLINLRGISSPFAAVPEVLNALDHLRSRCEVVDLSRIRAERIYDLLGLFDQASAMITVDTATLHLAAASNIPYVALVVDGARGSLPKGNCKLAVRYADAPAMASKIADVIDDALRTVPVKLTPLPIIKPKTCWMIGNPASNGGVHQERSTKIDLLYICVRSPSEPQVPRNFHEAHERFARTYHQFKPKIPHRLVVVCYNGERDEETESLFSKLNPEYAYYTGNGFDIGAYKSVGGTLDSDLLVCCNSQIHFHRHGWMERFREAFEVHGMGLYGPMCSYEIAPHVRGPCMVMPPSLIRKYPFKIENRENTYQAEVGEKSVTNWVLSQKLPALMVTWDEVLELPEWRKPANIFRRGNQENCLVWDRHAAVWAKANLAEKGLLSQLADGIADGRNGLEAKGFSIGRPKRKTVTVATVADIKIEEHAAAIEVTSQRLPIPPEQTMLISPKTVEGFFGKQFSLPEWNEGVKWELNDVCNFLLYRLHKFIETDVVILVHWDGYALHPHNWTERFLDYDYIGAPWPRQFRFCQPTRRVGNGGFCLRSKKWLKAASELPPLPKNLAEDVFSCVQNLDHFTKRGCTVAPLDLAMRWGMEHPVEEYPKWSLKHSFGFHGLIGSDPARSQLRLVPKVSQTEKVIA